MNQQDFNKQVRRIEDFAELNEVPIDHFLYQQLAQAARSFREGEFERAQFQLDDALAAAQDFGTSPRDYIPQASISETITLTETKLRKVIRSVIHESIFLSQNNNSGPGLAYGDDRYHDLARAYHQQGGTTVGGRELGTVPSDREEMIRAIEHCQEWTQNYLDEYDTAPPPASHSSWPDDYLLQFPDGNITKRHLYFICDSCRMEVIPAFKYTGLLKQIENDGRYK